MRMVGAMFGFGWVWLGSDLVTGLFGWLGLVWLTGLFTKCEVVGVWLGLRFCMVGLVQSYPQLLHANLQQSHFTEQY
jgi:hypothetical protein